MKRSSYSRHTFQKKEILWMILGLVCALACMLLPGSIVTLQANQKKDTILQINNSNYYNGRDVAAKMTFYERMKMISGEWDSQWQVVNQSDIHSITEIEEKLADSVSTIQNGDLEYPGYCYLNYQSVISIATSGMEIFYDAGIYPENAISEYNNWYRPTVTLYQYSDSFFEAYTCYVWMVQFDYYDGSMTHTILIDDTTGLILAGGIQGEEYQVSEDWAENMDTQITLPTSVVEYYQQKQGLNKKVLDVSEDDLYWPEYELWNTAYGLSDEAGHGLDASVQRKTFLLGADHGVNDYDAAVDEVKNLVDNDKFLYSIQWNDKQCWFYMLPFTVKISS